MILGGKAEKADGWYRMDGRHAWWGHAVVQRRGTGDTIGVDEEEDEEGARGSLDRVAAIAAFLGRVGWWVLFL